ncbi:MAG TPA: hypothetical protein VH476_08940 [Solirubrobacterales bacterium]|jgi:hypothetical protein
MRASRRAARGPPSVYARRITESTIVIDRRYRGFEQIAQGGYTSGLLAGFLGGAARVGLRGGVPMERPLEVREVAAGVALCDQDELLAEASRTPPLDRQR